MNLPLAFDMWNLQLPVPVALAVVATIGYLIGRRQSRETKDAIELKSRRELKRAELVAKQLEKIALDVRKNLAKHHSNIARFKDRVNDISEGQNETTWRDLCREAEEILGPTLEFAAQIAQAYDEIRQQSNNLMTFTEVRTDPLTGVCNRRTMDEALDQLFALKNRYDTTFSLAILDIDHFKRVNDEQGHLAGDYVLQNVARLLDETVRETDILTRYGGEEFVVLMPHTDFDGACYFAERMRASVEAKLPVTVSIGVAAAVGGESSDLLMHRADEALYAAKSAGRNRVFTHDGSTVDAYAPCETPACAELEQDIDTDTRMTTAK